MPCISPGKSRNRILSMLLGAALFGLVGCSSGGDNKGIIDAPPPVVSSSSDGGGSSSDGQQSSDSSSSSISSSSSTSTSSSSSTSAPEGIELSGPNGTFFAGLNVAAETIEAGATTSITLSFYDENSNPIPVPGTWSAASRCTGVFTAEIAGPEATASTLSFTYTAKGCVGEDKIRMEGADGASIYVVNAAINVEPDSVNSIVYLGAEPSQIAIQGSGGDEIAEVSFRVRGVNSTAGAPGQLVQFRVEGVSGGLSLVNSSAVSDENGVVVAQVQSGTTPTNVTIVARHVDTGIEVPSNGLVVATGLAADNHFNMGADIYNPWAWDRINEQAINITVAVTDKSGNPVVDGTVVNFVSEEGGAITPKCTTVDNTCTVGWKPDKRQPDNGRIQIFATVKGTEDFIDNNGNKIFDNGDTFIAYDDTYDLGEPYSDNNENGQYDLGEHYVDSNSDGDRDGADGLWNGLNCNDTARCSDDKTFVDLGTQITIYQSNGYGVGVCNFGTFETDIPAEVLVESSFSLRDLWVSDGNSFAENPGHKCPFGNPAPNGTTVEFSVSGGSLVGPSSWRIGNASKPTGAYGITYKAPGSGGVQTITLTITVPASGNSGEEVVVSYSWNVNIVEPPEPDTI